MTTLPKSVDPFFLLYLLILLIGVGSFIFGDFRNRMTQNIRNAAIWVLIFFSAIVLYGYKDVIEGQLFPRTAVSQIGDEISLTRARDGHFYATVNVNGTDITFVVDTGATNIVLSKDDALRIGLNPDELRYFGRAQTANGEVRTAAVRLGQMRFGNRLDENVPASVNEGQLDTSLLGMSYLSRFETIQITGNQLTLIP